MIPTGSSSGAITVRDTTSQSDQERGTEQRRRRQHDAMIGADDQSHQVRDDDADEADRSADRHRGAGGERRAHERDSLGADDVEAA